MRIGLLLSAAALSLAACGEEVNLDLPPTSDPSRQVKMDVTGLTSKVSSVALDTNGQAHWIKALASDTALQPATEFPARVSRFNTQGGCDFPAPQAGSIVTLVNLYGSSSPTSIFPTSKELLAKNTERLLDRSGNTVLMVLGKTAIVDPYEMTNVVITETSAPLHLVLASRDKIIWNFVLAEGVEISHVTLLGRGDVGVVNLPETVGVTAFNKRTLEKCDVNPAAPTSPKWHLASRSKEAFAEYKVKAARFAHWLAQNHKGAAEIKRIDGLGFSNVLIGPAPTTLETRVPYRGIGQAHVRMASKEKIEVMDRKAYALKIKSIAKAKAEQLAGMSLKEYGRLKKKRKN